MRILHVTDVYRPRVGGIEMFVEELAARQSADGHEVTVLTLTEDSETSTPRGEVIVLRAPSWAPVPLPFLPGAGLLDVTAYDAVHAHLSVVSPFSTKVAQAAVRAGVPTVATVHSMWTGREGWVRLVGAIAGWSRWPVVWTAVSTAAATAMQQAFTTTTPVLVVPNAVEIPWWRADPPIEEPGRPLTFVAVMRLAGRKRPLQLLEVLARTRAAVPDDVPLRALIVGEGPLEEKVRTRIDSLGLEDWVELTGSLSRTRIRDLYRSADVYVAPSYQESFGLAALEARATGLPVVAMRSGGVGEFVRHGTEGLLCADDEEMQLALTEFATDRALLAEVAAHNLHHPPTMDWRVALDGFDEAYVLAGRAVERADVPVLRG